MRKYRFGLGEGVVLRDVGRVECLDWVCLSVCLSASGQEDEERVWSELGLDL